MCSRCEINMGARKLVVTMKMMMMMMMATMMATVMTAIVTTMVSLDFTDYLIYSLERVVTKFPSWLDGFNTKGKGRETKTVCHPY